MAPATSNSQISSSAAPIDRINRLPIDIIRTIFIACAQLHPYWSDRISFPLKIRVVCRRWDIISLSTPSLWTVLSMGTDKPDNADVFLPRSGSSPLEVCLGSDTLTQPHSSDFLLQIAPRVQKIILLHSNREDIQFRSLPARLPNLLEFSTAVTTYYIDIESPNPQPRLLVLAAPSLRSLQLYEFNLEWSEFPTNQLTKLCIYEADMCPTSVHISKIALALRSLSHLQELELGNFRVVGLTSATQNWRILFNDLVSLRLDSFDSWPELNGIFRLVKAPRLKALRLKVKGFAPDSTEVVEFDFPLIESLELVGSALGPSPDYLSKNESDKLQRLVLSHYYPLSNPVDLYSILGSLGAKPSLKSLQTLQTKGVSPDELGILGKELVPSLRKILPHFSDVFLSAFHEKIHYIFQANSIRYMKDAAEEIEYWGRFDKGGMPEPEGGDERVFESWDVFRNWLKAKTGWDKDENPPHRLLQEYFNGELESEGDDLGSEEECFEGLEDGFSDEDASGADEEDEEDELDSDGDVMLGDGGSKDDEF